MEMNLCKHCPSKAFTQETGYGTLVCRSCGCENFTAVLNPNEMHGYCVPLHNPAQYTRLKRFKKYLHRAGRAQSQSSIPKDTWDFLLQGAPYRAPANIVRRLKKAPKHIRKKCYDSLPLLTHHLCPNVTVPTLGEKDKARALAAFKELDAAYSDGEPFVSYLYALEYILVHIGRGDMLPFINKISCKKRRLAYQHRLSRVFSSRPQTPV